MAVSPAETQPRGSLDFVESSVLEAVVPANSDVDIEEELSSWSGALEDEGGSLLPFLTQRHIILLDELLSIYVVFRTPLLEHDILKSYLTRLVVNVEAFAFSTAPVPESEPKTAPKEIIYSSIIRDENEPTIIRHGEGDNAHTYIIWKVDVFIARPQGRFHKPAVYFQPMASFKPAEKPKKDVSEDEYLPSRVWTALNLLQSFESDPALAGIHPRLSAMRINKITPSAPVEREMIRPIRNGQRLLFRMLPPLVWRVRYSHIQTALNDVSLIASLDLEIAPYATYDARIKNVEVLLNSGEAQVLSTPQDQSVLHRPGDQLTYLYKISPDLASDGTPALGNKGHFLTLKIEAQVFISKACRPNIAIEWNTPVDFTNDHTASLIRAAKKLNVTAAQSTKQTNPDSLPAHDIQSQQEHEGGANDINVTLTISGPPNVKVGNIFTWDVFIVNRSNKTRKLAVLVIAKRKREIEKHQSHPSTSSVSSLQRGDKELLATAVVDENIVYAKQKSARTETADLLCLTTDIRLGQLSPGSCYTAALKFVALSAGVLTVESVRVIDLATNETADIRDLPKIVATEEQE
ncbi:hypothetical protein IQ07DRAFT_509600 [Pyrenochaeta sp. DS3sAY3a]|nr:hypothetical protein IQ07DRAFT_509600 [Pyrenochaeta sp. DS3sAY3a]